MSRGGTPSDPFPIDGFHHIEFWTDNAYQSAQFFRSLMGFAIEGYRGPETGVRDTASWALRQGEARFLVTEQLSQHLIVDLARDQGVPCAFIGWTGGDTLALERATKLRIGE